MSEKLKPCQYCNGDSLRLVGSSLNKTLQLECLNCGAEGPRAGSVKDAEAAWNTRTDPAKDAMREALIECAKWIEYGYSGEFETPCKCDASVGMPCEVCYEKKLVARVRKLTLDKEQG